MRDHLQAVIELAIEATAATGEAFVVYVYSGGIDGFAYEFAIKRMVEWRGEEYLFVTRPDMFPGSQAAHERSMRDQLAALSKTMREKGTPGDVDAVIFLGPQGPGNN